MKYIFFVFFSVIVICQLSGTAQTNRSNAKLKIVLAGNSYNGSREVAEISPGPAALEQGGLLDELSRAGYDVVSRSTRLNAAEDKLHTRGVPKIPLSCTTVLSYDGIRPGIRSPGVI